MSKLNKKQVEFLNTVADYNWSENPDGTIHVSGSVHLENRMLTKVSVKFSEVEETIRGENNRFTSLEWLPEKIGLNLYLDNNELTSLKGCPKIVGGDFYCGKNKLKNLEGCPESIGGNFDFKMNQINTLKWFPKKVKKSCFYYGNPISEDTLSILIRAMYSENVDYFNAVLDCLEDIPEKDLKIMELPEGFLEKHRGFIAAKGLGLV